MRAPDLISSLEKDHRALFLLAVVSPHALARQKHEPTAQEGVMKQRNVCSCMEAQRASWLSFSPCPYRMQVSKKFFCMEAQPAGWLSFSQSLRLFHDFARTAMSHNTLAVSRVPDVRKSLAV